MSKILVRSRIGIVPLNWRYDSTKMEDFVSGIAGYGFKGIQVSGDQAESDAFLQQMRNHDLVPAEQYVAIRCGIDGPLLGSEAESAKTIEQAVAAKVEMLVFAVDGSEARDRCAGRAEAGPQLTAEGFTRLASHVETFAIAASRHGIRSSFHPHAGTFVESVAETRALMGRMDPLLVGLCLDVGHWIVGGGDPIDAVNEYRHRITHVHVKDVSGDVLRKLVSGLIETMNTAVEEFKLFVPAGTGILDLNNLFLALEGAGFTGWLMSEQDSAWEPSQAASGISMANILASLEMPTAAI